MALAPEARQRWSAVEQQHSARLEVLARAPGELLFLVGVP